jgi:hypothetical protein
MARPPCDRHPNLQMVPLQLESRRGKAFVHVCPVPGCGRHHDGQGYFEVVDGQPVREENVRPSDVLSGERFLRAIRARAGG